MNKFWMVYSLKNDGRLTRYEVEADAVSEAQRRAHADAAGDPVFVLETVDAYRRPLPQVERIGMTGGAPPVQSSPERPPS